jgi:hypothetical protein
MIYKLQSINVLKIKLEIKKKCLKLFGYTAIKTRRQWLFCRLRQNSLLGAILPAPQNNLLSAILPAPAQ